MKNYREFTTNLNPKLKDSKSFDKTKKVSRGRNMIFRWKEPLVEVFYFHPAGLPDEKALNEDSSMGRNKDKDGSTHALKYISVESDLSLKEPYQSALVRTRNTSNTANCAGANLEMIRSEGIYKTRKSYDERRIDRTWMLCTCNEGLRDIYPLFSGGGAFQKGFERKRFLTFDKRRTLFREQILQLEGEWV